MRYLTRLELERLSRGEREAILRRSAVPNVAVRRRAAEIVEEVRKGGDEAMTRLAAAYGGGFRRVPDSEIDAATKAVDPEVTRAVEAAAERVAIFHRAQLPSDLAVSPVPGVDLARRWAPLQRVGAYVPGGKAAYPSTVVMTAVPARVAGVEEIVVAVPAGESGQVEPVVLAACRLTGVDEVWSMGGAQAIAALAHGTETLRPVQKIVGPGSAWVTAAKLEVNGVCAIDLPAGPSEVLVLADHTADPRLVAIDLLCQAEHGPDSPAVLVTTDPDLPTRVDTEIQRLLPGLDRAEILEGALTDHGLAIVAPDREAALDLANAYAAEHVTIVTSDPDADAKRITGAGSVYVGHWSPESAGDYATGANHVLPTGGLAAACGPLSVEDFGSWRQEQRLSEEGLGSILSTISTLAEAEGFAAHRLAAEMRFTRIDDRERGPR